MFFKVPIFFVDFSDFSVKRAERADDDMSAGYNRYELNAQVLDIQIHPSEKV